MLQEVEIITEQKEKFTKGHREGFTNSKFDLVVQEQVDIDLTRGRSYKSHGRGKHRTLVKGVYALHTLREGGWRY